jgi:hypothetical protein
MDNVFVAVHGFFEIPNSKHQRSNKSQIPNINNLNHFDNCDIDEDALSICFTFLQEYKVWNLEFSLKQHPFLKKDHSFRFPRRRLSEPEANFQRFRTKLPDPSKYNI